MDNNTVNPEYTDLVNKMSLYDKIKNGVWIPNICLNQVTGEAWFAGNRVHFNADGSGDIVNVLS